MNKNEHKAPKDITASSLPVESFLEYISEHVFKKNNQLPQVKNKNINKNNILSWSCEDNNAATEFALKLLNNLNWDERVLFWIKKSAPYAILREIISVAAKPESAAADQALGFFVQNCDPRDIANIFSQVNDERFMALFERFPLLDNINASLFLTRHAKDGNLNKIIFLTKKMNLGTVEDLHDALCDRKTPHSDDVNEVLLCAIAQKISPNEKDQLALCRDALSFSVEKTPNLSLKSFFGHMDQKFRTHVLIDFLQNESSKNTRKVIEGCCSFLPQEEIVFLCASVIAEKKYQIAHHLALYMNNPDLIDMALMNGLTLQFKDSYPLFSVSLSRQLLRGGVGSEEKDGAGDRGKRKL